jgi:TonB family protein
MKHLTLRSAVALFGYVSFLAAAGTAAAQIGPVQPVLVQPTGNPEIPHDRPNFQEDYSVPMDVYVNAQGKVTNVVVTQSTSNVEADGAAASFMRDRQFLPAVNESGEAMDALVRVNVNMFKRGSKKVARVTIKPPPVALELDRVQRMTCADFLWEVERMHKEAKIRDTSFEQTPYMSALLYKQKRNVPIEVESEFWDKWTDMHEKVVKRCDKQQTRMYFTDVLMPALDGTLPASETVTASSVSD